MFVNAGCSYSTEKLRVKWLFLRSHQGVTPGQCNYQDWQWFPYNDGQEGPRGKANPQKDTLSQKKEMVVTNI